MGDGIKYVFEVEGQAPGMGALIAKLDVAEKLLLKVAENTGKAGTAHKKHEEHAKGLVGAFHRLIHQGMEPFLKKAKQVAEFEFIRKGADALIEAPGEMIEKLKELGEEMVITAANAERTNKSFKLLFGAQEGSEMLEFIDDVAQHTEFTAERLKSAAATLGKVGFHGTDLKRALQASSDMAALSGGKEGGLDSALGSLEEVKRTGMVRRGTLSGLGIGNQDFFAQLSTRTGESVEVLKKKMAAGKVDASDAIESLYTVIAKKTGKKLGGAGADMGNLLGAKLTHLQELPERFFEKLADSPGLASFTEAISHVLEELSPDSPRGKEIFAALEGAFNSVGEWLKNVDVASLGETLAGGFKTLAGFLGDLPGQLELPIKLLTDMWGVVKGIAGVLHDYTPLGFVADQAADAQRISAENRVKAAALKKGLDLEKWGSSDEEEPGFLVKGKSGLVKGLKNAKAGAREAGAEVGASAVEGAASPDGIDARSPSKKFEALGNMVGEGFALGVGSGAIDDVLAGAFAVPAPQGGRMAAGGGGAPVVITIGDIVVHAGPNAGSAETAQAVRSAVRDELTDMFEHFRSEQGA